MGNWKDAYEIRLRVGRDYYDIERLVLERCATAVAENGRETAGRANKFQCSSWVLWLADGAGKPKNRSSPGPDYHRIRFSVRERKRERGPLPYFLKNSLLQLPRNETSRLKLLLLGYISFSNKLLHFSFRDSVEDKFVGIGKIDQWYTKLIGLERDSESLIVPVVFFILSMDIVLDFLLFFKLSIYIFVNKIAKAVIARLCRTIEDRGRRNEKLSTCSRFL